MQLQAGSQSELGYFTPFDCCTTCSRAVYECQLTASSIPAEGIAHIAPPCPNIRLLSCPTLGTIPPKRRFRRLPRPGIHTLILDACCIRQHQLVPPCKYPKWIRMQMMQMPNSWYMALNQNHYTIFYCGRTPITTSCSPVPPVRLPAFLRPSALRLAWYAGTHKSVIFLGPGLIPPILGVPNDLNPHEQTTWVCAKNRTPKTPVVSNLIFTINKSSRKTFSLCPVCVETHVRL